MGKRAHKRNYQIPPNKKKSKKSKPKSAQEAQESQEEEKTGCDCPTFIISEDNGKCPTFESLNSALNHLQETGVICNNYAHFFGCSRCTRIYFDKWYYNELHLRYLEKNKCLSKLQFNHFRNFSITFLHHPLLMKKSILVCKVSFLGAFESLCFSLQPFIINTYAEELFLAWVFLVRKMRLQHYRWLVENSNQTMVILNTAMKWSISEFDDVFWKQKCLPIFFRLVSKFKKYDKYYGIFQTNHKNNVKVIQLKQFIYTISNLQYVNDFYTRIKNDVDKIFFQSKILEKQIICCGNIKCEKHYLLSKFNMSVFDFGDDEFDKYLIYYSNYFLVVSGFIKLCDAEDGEITMEMISLVIKYLKKSICMDIWNDIADAKEAWNNKKVFGKWQLCSKCQLQLYCSKKCQKIAWVKQNHAAFCF